MRPAARSGASLRALSSIEAKRYLRRVTVWVGLALTVVLMVIPGPSADESWSGQTYENAVPLSFFPLTIGVFIAALRTGGRDRTPATILADGAPLDADDRAFARLVALVAPVALSAVAVVAVAIVSRIEGGFWIGEAPRRTDAALHSVVELLQPPLIVGVAGASGIALGRTFKRLTPTIVVGSTLWFLAFVLYWVWNNAGLHAIAPAQLQPMRIDLPTTTKIFEVPADWFVNAPNQYDGWQRAWVHLPTVAWHNVYLLGVVLLWSGLAIRKARGGLVALGGCGLAVAGVAAQLIVSPF
jgi:hypothetical protein